MLLTYDPDADVLELIIRPYPHGLHSSFGERVDARRIVHRERTTRDVLGVEFLFASEGVNVDGLPQADTMLATLNALRSALPETTGAPTAP